MFFRLDGRGTHRDGKTGIYRQGTHQQALERVISGSEGYANAHLSADGSLLLYTAFGKEGNLSSPA